jgi:autonomous glycyl radical cofactor GrcA
MADDVTREEFDHLRTRVDIAEREIDGEKLVTRHILEQTRHNGDDLAAIKSRLGRIEENLTGVDLKALVRTVGDLDRKVDGLDRRIDDLTRALPRIVGDAVRDANKERRARRRPEGS